MRYDIRLRRYRDDGTPAEVLQDLSLSFPTEWSTQSTLRFQVSAHVGAALPEAFVVAVEVTGANGRYIEVPNGRLLASEADTDDVDPARVKAYSAVHYVPWLLRGATVGTAGAVDGQREFVDASAGGILRPLLDGAKARGALARVNFAFTAAADSSSVVWPAGDVTTQKFDSEMRLDRVLEALTKQNLLEWWTEGMTLKVAVPGTGQDLASTVFLGPDASREPAKSSSDNLVTHLYVIPEDAEAFWMTNPGASVVHGRLEATLRLTGVADRATAERLGAAYLDGARDPQREDSVVYSASAAAFLPWIHYRLGDVVERRGRSGGNSSLRVVGLVLTKSAGEVEVAATLGYRFPSLIGRLAGRIAMSTGGSAVGGSGGQPVPPPRPSYRLPPKRPEALQADSNVGYWGEGNVPYARAVVSWVPVTQATDDSPITVAGYDVWVAFDAGEWAQLASTQVSQVDLDRLRPGSLVRVMVAARSAAGGVSVESAVLQFTAATPITATAAPTPPALESKLGLVSARWDGALVDALVTPSLAHVAAEWTTDPLEGDWAAFGSPLRARGSATLTGRPPGELVYVSLVAVSLNGTRARSEVRTVEVVGVAGPDIEAGTIRAAHIEAGSITVNELSPSIGDDLNLSANGTITLIAGQAAAAQGAAAAAVETASEAQATANGAAEQLAITQTSFQVRPDGAYVTSPQSEYALALKAGQIEIQENGAVATYWNAGQMVVPQLVSPRVTLGNHQIEAQAGGHTIFRAL